MSDSQILARPRLRLGVGLLGVLAAGVAAAGTITLDSTVNVTRTGNEVEIAVDVQNHGDEAASNAWPLAWIGDATFLFPHTTVPAGENRVFVSRQRLPPAATPRPGAYPVMVETAYQDVYGSRYFSPSYGILATTNPVPRLPFSLDVAPVRLSSRAALEARVHNVGAADAFVQVSAYTTRDVAVGPARLRLAVKAGATATARFTLTNVSARRGTIVPVVLFLEGDAPAGHGTLAAEAALSVLEDAPQTVPAAARRRYTRAAVAAAAAAVLLGSLVSLWLAWRGRGRRA